MTVELSRAGQGHGRTPGLMVSAVGHAPREVAQSVRAQAGPAVHGVQPLLRQ